MVALSVGCSGGASDQSAAASADSGAITRESLAKFGASFYTEPPPASLDRFYPPHTQRMEYRDLMREMYLPESFARQEAQRGQWDAARRSWARFIERFTRLRTVVPEWEARFGTVDEWQSAIQPILASGTPADAERLERTQEALFVKHCEECHATERQRVYARYHFGTFRTVWAIPPKIDDPLIQVMLTEWKGKAAIPDGTVSFRDYMKLMNTSLMTAWNLADAGEIEAARVSMSRLETYLDAIPPVCAECHGGEPRRYFIDADSLEKFHAVSRALAGATVDRADVVRQLRDAFDNTCSRCHDIHLIPAKLQRAWALAANQVAPAQ